MKRLWVIVLPLFFAACVLIDDDLSVCGEELVVNYQMQLHTELSMQLQTELMMEAEIPVRNALEKWLEPIFTETAKDVDLRFFSSETDELRHHIHEIINDKRTSYTIQLPKENYMHLGVANIEDNNQVHMTDVDHAESLKLSLVDGKNVPSLSTGVFTARLPMEIGDTSANFEVHLYMANSAVALVADTTICDSLLSMSGTVIGSAISFAVRDSIYTYDDSRAIVLDDLPIKHQGGDHGQKMRSAEEVNDTYACMVVSTFPTEDDKPWNVVVKTTMVGNRHTTTTLKLEEPLKAGTLRIIRVHVDEEGALQPDAGQEVGASVELDWKQGGEHEVDL